MKFVWQYICLLLAFNHNISNQWCRRRGCKQTPKSYDLSKIQAKSLKMWSNALKIWVKSLSIQAKSLQIWEKMAPNVWRKTNEDIFLRSHQIRPHDLCGRKFVGKSGRTTFRKSLGKFGQKSFAPPNVSNFHKQVVKSHTSTNIIILPSCCRNWYRQMAFQTLACRRLPLNKIKKEYQL